MRRSVLAVTLAVAAAAVCYTQTAARSIWDGVYTEEQARRGQALYPDNCSRCHGDELEGDEAPALRSEEFLSDWKGHSLGDLFARVKNAMPGDAPGTLSSGQTADVIAYILSRNHVPSGSAPMATSVTALKQIRMDK